MKLHDWLICFSAYHLVGNNRETSGVACLLMSGVVNYGTEVSTVSTQQEGSGFDPWVVWVPFRMEFFMFCLCALPSTVQRCELGQMAILNCPCV